VSACLLGRTSGNPIFTERSGRAGENGRDAIRAWVAETSRKYQSTLTLLRETVNGDDVRLSVAVSGQFPGSPVTLDFKMRMQRGKIAALTIG